ncbi:hypothetical protein P691DRAFT_824153 [Macrolepiota fuliginosa MF-IS2]|uniref:Nitrogen regulatory protein areA GATA-like domain-containing protein n=1 Tax=Macrolepiota fuliginosa MF-IS2 TaxID=1400762 RepID=A0A9P5X9D8_9AGAR|nr:hypothetical protein P691DRAFT_824153 [Macrolepiota fuliginosa MF-IS2]
MANYLPVLLVSVNANAIPDDNVLTTMPQGQVDYLSHDWQEEDVWRSWRNMTRQKNEITNGIRLENASWRTWWKQRNKLKTVSPETLNWLKDSDVTWLYGPLHTAVEWTPPPKPHPVPDSVDSGNPASTHDRLDLHSASSAAASRHSQPPRTKPILKHRSISELLTSDLPVSPIFSPQESEEDEGGAHSLFPDPSDQDVSKAHKRPALVHTRSDTHITRWGSRAFRKDSPPRVEPPTSLGKSSSHPSASTVRASGAMRSSLSRDSASSASASGSSERTTKKKHISFNTFVERCIAIDGHPRKGSRKGGSGFGDYVDYEYNCDEDEAEDDESYNGKWDIEDGYEEDREDNFFDEDDPLWLAAHGGARPRRRHLNGSAIHSDSDSDDGVIEIRPSAYRHSNVSTPHAKKKAPPRSKSASSTSSTATTTTTSSASSSGGGIRQRRKSTSTITNSSHLLSAPPPASAYRPRPMQSSSSDPPYRDRVTIAPIAPTLLKTTGAWEEGFGDEGGASDDGLWDYGVPRHGVNGRPNGSGGRNKKGVGGRPDEEQSSEGTPVELVYVPPFGSIYGYGAATYWRNRGAADEDEEEIDEEDETEEIEEVEDAHVQLTAPRQDESPDESSPVREIVEQESASSLIPAPLIPKESTSPVSRSPVPVIVEPSADTVQLAPDVSSEQIESNTHSSDSTSTPTPVLVPQGERQVPEGGRRGRSASISPIGVNSTRPPVTANANPLAPGSRSQSCQDLQSFYNTSVATTSVQGGERRGRSSIRAPSNSGNGTSSGSWRGLSSGRSSQSHSGGRSGGSGSVSPNNNSNAPNTDSSPIGGSLSPDGTDPRLGGVGSAYAGGRMGGRERERVERVGSSSSLSSKATSAAGGGSGSDERRGRDRGRRVIGSGSGSSSSPIASATSSHEETRERGRSGGSTRGRGSLSPQDVFDIDPALSSPTTTIAINGEMKDKDKESVVSAETSISVASDITGQTSQGAQGIDMEASMCSVSSEGSTATIVPTSSMVAPPLAPSTPVVVDALSPSDRERQFERQAMEEAETWRKTMPTPSNSPTISMTAPRVGPSEKGAMTPTPPTIPPTSPPLSSQTPAYTPGHVRTASSSSTYSQSTPSSKLKTGSATPAVPSPPRPSLPSTSSSHAPGEVGPSVIFTGPGVSGRNASTSLERASSGSRERQSPCSTSSSTTHPGSGLRREITADMERERELAEARRGRNSVVGNTTVNVVVNGSTNVSVGPTEPRSPILGGFREETIIDKAVGMVSSAGAYLRLWPNYGGA